MEDLKMEIVLHSANTRGHADHGWLKSSHTFSCGSYFNAVRIQYRTLRVLNDDYVAGGQGFGMHPHNDMEIISIPLEGTLVHQDSMGNRGTIRPNEIQVMSAGTGVHHSEFNGSADHAVRFLQIWVLPDEQQVKPRYDQITLDPEDRKNKFQQVVSPNPDDEGTWIHQQAWFHLADLEEGITVDYTLKDSTNGIYVFVLEGSVGIAREVLERRDAIGITGITAASFQAETATSLLVIEVPMEKY